MMLIPYSFVGINMNDEGLFPPPLCRSYSKPGEAGGLDFYRDRYKH